MKFSLLGWWFSPRIIAYPNTCQENPSFELLIRVVQETPKLLQAINISLGCPPSPTQLLCEKVAGGGDRTSEANFLGGFLGKRAEKGLSVLTHFSFHWGIFLSHSLSLDARDDVPKVLTSLLSSFQTISVCTIAISSGKNQLWDAISLCNFMLPKHEEGSTGCEDLQCLRPSTPWCSSFHRQPSEDSWVSICGCLMAYCGCSELLHGLFIAWFYAHHTKNDT